MEWWNGLRHYDLVYMSKVFTDAYSPDHSAVIRSDQIIMGGTGYNLDGKLPDEVESIYPDYTLYAAFPDTAYGFLTRGCPRRCPFCIVSRKEGCLSHRVAELADFRHGQKTVMLLDPNILACTDHEGLLRSLAASKAWVDFAQGLDIRLTTPDNIPLIDRIKTPTLRFAWDNPREDLTEYFRRFCELTVKKKRKRRVYILINFNSSHEEDEYRVNTLRALGYDPYVMVYNKSGASLRHTRFQRYVNNKRIFNVVPTFAEYDTRIG